MNLKNRVFIIAEISANHGQDFGRAVQLIKKAKGCGADAVKFQAYMPDTMTIDVDNSYFHIKHGRWAGQTLYALYRKAYTPWAWFKGLKRTADEEGLLFFSTAFDKSSVDMLEDIGVPCHKIASFELVDLALIDYAARTKKPLFLSTGMAEAADIKKALDTARKAGARQTTLLRCVSSYPARSEDMNLATVSDMRRRFKCPVGLSDHTLGIGVSVAAVALGATAIEKHFTLSRKIKTPDSFFSLEPGEFKGLVENIRVAQEALGGVSYGAKGDQRGNAIFRRSLFAVQDIKKGELFTPENVRSIRPGYGLPPSGLSRILGRRCRRTVRRGTPLNWGLVR